MAETDATRAERFFNLRALDVAAHHIQPDSARGKQDSVQAVQTSHRLDILYAWLTGKDPHANTPDIPPVEVEPEWELLSGRLMDLGCGQGDQTGALAAMLAAHQDKFSATIVGVDPAPPDYGAPYTIKQAQDHLSQQPALSNHLSFILGDTGPKVLESQRFDTVLLSHSLWYFPSTTILRDTFKAIKESGVKHLLLAEWAMTASHPNSVPHLLSALLQGQSPVKGSNVQTLISPEQLKKLASEAGWKVSREVSFCPAEKLQDGEWEIYGAREAAEQAAQLELGEGDQVTRRMVQSVQATRYALEEAVGRIRQKQVRSMDVWTAVLTPA